eukprot:gene3997-2852_t
MESVEAVEVFSHLSGHYRYRVPLSVIQNFQYERSHYSPEFEVGGRQWRFHIGERTSGEDRFLSVHLQSCSPGTVPVHFKLSVTCIRDPQRSKSKTFHCTFKKGGSAWGLHQFIPIGVITSPDRGFLYIVEETGEKCFDVEVTMQIQEPNHGSAGGRLNARSPQRVVQRHISPERVADANIPRRSISRSPYGVGPSRSISRGASPRMSVGGDAQPSFQTVAPHPSVSPFGRGRSSTYYDANANLAEAIYAEEKIAGIRNAPRAPLSYPFEHLEALCDMSFDVQGVRVKAHRCVIGARMKPLLPEHVLPLQPGCVVAIAVPLDVFTTFLRYVYTEEVPEKGVLTAESLLDLYLLSSACEFYDMCAVCLKFVRPMLSAENILPIVLTRYNAADEVLTALYLKVLLDSYDLLIQDTKFEEIPGHLFRRLSLILYQKETIRPAPIPPMKQSLGKQLAALAESGEYSDVDWVVGPQRYTIRGHRFILASRSIAFAQAANPRQPAALPNVTTPEFDFSLRSWHKLLIGIYQRHLDTDLDFSAEDITIVFKMHAVLGMDGHLKKEADNAFSSNNALRLLVYAVKHQMPELHERAISYVASHFAEMARNDPQVWELISELPQPAVVSLLRSVTEAQP